MTTDEETHDPDIRRMINRLPVGDAPDVDLALAKVREQASPARVGAARRSPVLLIAVGAACAVLGAGITLAVRGVSNASAQPPVLGFQPASGWTTVQTTLANAGGAQIAWTTNGPISSADGATEMPLTTVKTLSPQGVVVYASRATSVSNPDEYRDLAFPLQLSDSRILNSGYENQPAPQVSTEIIGAHVNGEYLLVEIWFGTPTPSGAALAAADDALGRLEVP